MTKKSLLSLFLLLLSTIANAQDFWTIKLAADWAKPVSSSKNLLDFKTRIGTHLGASYTHYLVKGLFVEPEANISYDEWKIPDLYEVENVLLDHRYQNLSLNVPVVLGYSIPVGRQHLYVYTGPQASLNLMNKCKVKMNVAGKDYNEIEEYMNYDYNKLTLDWKAGIGVTLDEFTVGVEATRSLTKMYKDEGKFHKQVISVVLGKTF